MPFCVICHGKITQDHYAKHQVARNDLDLPCHSFCLKGDKMTIGDFVRKRFK